MDVACLHASVFNVALINFALFLISLLMLHYFNVPLLYVALFDVALFIVALFTVHYLMLHYVNVALCKCYVLLF